MIFFYLGCIDTLFNSDKFRDNVKNLKVVNIDDQWDNLICSLKVSLTFSHQISLPQKIVKKSRDDCIWFWILKIVDYWDNPFKYKIIICTFATSFTHHHPWIIFGTDCASIGFVLLSLSHMLFNHLQTNIPNLIYTIEYSFCLPLQR